ncbi:nitrilase family protein [Oricola indica]|uniref:nitrilase family protein n=1 Tax=Oricola indica TaxID=2872591 RepID=UPI001CC05B62|nr:nitrilase family protein [Oricola indica]
MTEIPIEAVDIACIQFEPRFGAVADNLARSGALIEQAADSGAEIVVLPELANTGYVFENREEALALAEPVPEGQSTRFWGEIATRRKLFLISGITERDGEHLYNTAVVIGPEGVLGVYRKLHLWADEKLWFEPGNLGVPVFDTPHGRIGVAICYDGWFPETFRLAALAGADLMCVPTNWVPIPGQSTDQQPMANVLHMAAAHSNVMAIACADRVGVERNQSFIGHSLIVSHTGWPVSGPASGTEEEIVSARLDLSAARRAQTWNGTNHPIHDRRTDVYSGPFGTETPTFNASPFKGEKK